MGLWGRGLTLNQATIPHLSQPGVKKPSPWGEGWVRGGHGSRSKDCDARRGKKPSPWGEGWVRGRTRLAFEGRH